MVRGVELRSLGRLSLRTKCEFVVGVGPPSPLGVAASSRRGLSIQVYMSIPWAAINTGDGAARPCSLKLREHFQS